MTAKIQTSTIQIICMITIVLTAFSSDLLAQRRGGRGGYDGPVSDTRLDPEDVPREQGAAEITDFEMFEEFSYTGPEVMIDTHLAYQQFVKFQIERCDTEEPQLYFINTKNIRAHPMFMQAIGLGRGFGRPREGDPVKTMRGVLIHHPNRKAPDGRLGLFTFEYEPFDKYAYEHIKLSHDMLISKMPYLEGRIAYFPMPAGVPQATKDKELYDASDVVLLFEKDIESNVGFLALNMRESFGRLKLMTFEEQPGSRDIVLCNTLPNEMPRVAGVISAVRQTPLSHVNLRAVQDGVPNAYIADAGGNEKITSLLDKWVYYKVTADGFELREATDVEVENHFASIRPAEPQTPVRNLTVQAVRTLKEIAFDDWKSVGVKAANVAVLQSIGLPDGTVPDGVAIPFYFYDEFMKHNGLYESAREMLAVEEFKNNPETQKEALKAFRKQIREGEMPDWMMEALDAAHKTFPEGTSVRCRSSTNNEDLPGFSGAGLYDSCTHHLDEGHFSKSVKQVFASAWNFRAYEERDFYRIDHFETAMGVLCHPNYSDELANGVAVTEDILYQTQGNHYINTQVGEDLVTNPDEESIPEEILLDWSDGKKFKIQRYSNRAEDGKTLLSEEQLEELRVHLGRIHSRFSKLYGVDLQDEKFAMEIEFKITAQGKLAIKQARPWVFAPEAEDVEK